MAIHLNGSKTPPLVITKGTKDTTEHVSDICVLQTEKAWSTQAVTRKWINFTLPLILQGSQRSMIGWDAGSTHCAKNTKKFLPERKNDQIMIPAGMTAYLRTLDTAINKLFKGHLHMKINDYIEKRIIRNDSGNFVKLKLENIVTWMANS